MIAQRRSNHKNSFPVEKKIEVNHQCKRSILSIPRDKWIFSFASGNSKTAVKMNGHSYRYDIYIPTHRLVHLWLCPFNCIYTHRWRDRVIVERQSMRDTCAACHSTANFAFFALLDYFFFSSSANAREFEQRYRVFGSFFLDSKELFEQFDEQL